MAHTDSKLSEILAIQWERAKQTSLHILANRMENQTELNGRPTTQTHWDFHLSSSFSLSLVVIVGSPEFKLPGWLAGPMASLAFNELAVGIINLTSLTVGEAGSFPGSADENFKGQLRVSAKST